MISCFDSAQLRCGEDGRRVFEASSSVWMVFRKPSEKVLEVGPTVGGEGD